MTEAMPKRPRVDVPEEDWVEQNVETQPIFESDFEQTESSPDIDLLEANEADVAEQQISAYSDEDDR
jgi:hypothetical protein